MISCGCGLGATCDRTCLEGRQAARPQQSPLLPPGGDPAEIPQQRGRCAGDRSCSEYRTRHGLARVSTLPRLGWGRASRGWDFQTGLWGESAGWRAVLEICWRSPANPELVIVDGREGMYPWRRFRISLSSEGPAGVVPLFEIFAPLTAGQERPLRLLLLRRSRANPPTAKPRASSAAIHTARIVTPYVDIDINPRSRDRQAISIEFRSGCLAIY